MRRAILTAVAALGLVLPASGVAASAPVQIRHVDLGKYPLVRVTAVVPKGARPTLLEAGRRAGFAKTRELGTAEAMMLVVDNSESMAGRPLREAKRAATRFLTSEQHAGTVGVVAFGHEALALTRAGEVKSDAARTLAALGTDTEPGTSLYDAVQLSVSHLKRMSSRTRILVLLTDGRDRGSQSSLSDAIAAAQQANVIVFAIAAGEKADKEPLAALTEATGGRIFKAADPSTLTATYAALGKELARTWQISYLTVARPGDRTTLTVRAGGEASSAQLGVPQEGGRGGLFGSLPSSVAHSGITAAAVVLLAALLLAGAGVVGNRRRRTTEISRLLESHVTPRDADDSGSRRGTRFASLLEWTERSLDDLPGSQRLARSLERSGLELRLGYVPYVALFASFFLGIVGTIMGAGAFFAILLMLIGLVSPLLVFRIAGRRRSKAFDKQLPDVLSTIASTLRAGHGLRMALRAVADDGSPPASEEFTRVLGEERLGRPLDRALAAMCERIGSEDMDYVATAVNVQSQAGGSLATLFDTLSETVRERQRHARKVRALTSMGRMSGATLICLPIGLAGLMTLISPHYMAPLFTTSTGHVIIALCLTSMAIGGLFLKKIVNVRY